MENEIETVKIKGINYIILDRIDLNNNTYVYLVNEDDEEDFFVNKIIKKDDKDFLTGLDSEDEVKAVIQAYVEKNANFE